MDVWKKGAKQRMGIAGIFGIFPIGTEEILGWDRNSLWEFREGSGTGKFMETQNDLGGKNP